MHEEIRTRWPQKNTPKLSQRELPQVTDSLEMLDSITARAIGTTVGDPMHAAMINYPAIKTINP